ncbi:MAG: RICIN domain-containing protein [Bdellovibrionales bacterium]|nr:RICIN domain-containing protein [Bdellovibrionales bacterium]
MEGPQNLFFTPNPEIPYKIISVMDPHKAFTLHGNNNKLVISDYTAAHNQLFKVYQQNNRYAFVSPQIDSALHVDGNNKGDGGLVRADPGQFESSFFNIVPVNKGNWAGKACHILTFSDGKALDIKGGKANPNTDICQWKFHGNPNQQWLVIPADNIPQKAGKHEQHH